MSYFESNSGPGSDDEVPSPCVRECCLDTNEVCLGCFRALPEILIWHNASDAQKREILIQCRKRKQARGPSFRRD